MILARYRRFPLPIILATFFWVSSCLVTAAQGSTQDIYLRDDSFYDPPADYKRFKPGTVLRTRPIPPGSLKGLTAKGRGAISSAWQLLYRTTDAHMSPSVTVTTLIKPKNASHSKVLSYQVASDSAAPQCLPSYTLLKHPDLGDTSDQAENLVIENAIEQGWYVVVPDYDGERGTFGCGICAGHAILDSIRAIFFSTLGEIRSDAPVAFWGYSGGAFATGWAATLQPTYAPELNLVGAAFGGTPIDLQSNLQYINKTPYAGLIPGGVLGLAKAYPKLNDYVQSQLLPQKKHQFNIALRQCPQSYAATFVNDDLLSYFKSDIMNARISVKAHRANRLNFLKARVPLFVYHAIHDQVVPFKAVRNLIQNHCSDKIDVEFLQDKEAEHFSMLIVGAPKAYQWLNARLNGIPVKPGCTVTTITPGKDLDPAALSIFGKSIFNLTRDILNQAE